MWSQWYLIKDKSVKCGCRIRRYSMSENKVKWERFPAKNYSHLSHDEIESLVRRLNITYELERRNAEERYLFDHAWINPKLKQKFEEKISRDITKQAHQKMVMHYLDKFIFTFFVHVKNTPDPKFWVKHEVAFGTWLTARLALNTCLQVIAVTNRYLRFLHSEYPDEIPLILLNPIGRKKIKVLKQEAKVKDQRQKYIPPHDYSEIEKKLPSRLRPAFCLMYNYGLRLGEVLALTPEDVFEEELDIKRQVIAFSNGKRKFGTLKDIDEREVPHWFATPEQALSWIEQLTFMTPSNLSKELSRSLNELGFEFKPYDCRRSFVTNSHENQYKLGITVRDIQKAAGHAEWETTMGYLQNVKKAEKRIFRRKEQATS